MSRSILDPWEVTQDVPYTHPNVMILEGSNLLHWNYNDGLETLATMLNSRPDLPGVWCERERWYKLGLPYGKASFPNSPLTPQHTGKMWHEFRVPYDREHYVFWGVDPEYNHLVSMVAKHE